MTFMPFFRLRARSSGLSCRALGSALLAAGLLTLTGCGEKAADATAGGAGKKKGGGGPAPVLVAKAVRKVVPLALDAIGAVEPLQTAALKSQVTGTLIKIAIQEGQEVKQGDLLFEIDPRPFENALRLAQADQQKVRVQLETASAQVTRYRTLSAESMVSKEQFQQIQDNERALKAASAASEAAVANAKLQLEYCSIRAPFAGRTGNLGVHVGDLVRASDATITMVTLNQISPIYVTFNVPQQNLAALNRYRDAGTLAVSALPSGVNDRPEKGELTFLDNAIDPTTGTLKLKATFANTDHRLWPGQFVSVRVVLDSPVALTVPTPAVQNSQRGQHLFVVGDDKKAELRVVAVERILEGDAVITKGITEGETVITEGQLRVVSGREVDIKQPASATGEGGEKKGKGKGNKGEGGKGGKDKDKTPEKGAQQ